MFASRHKACGTLQRPSGPTWSLPEFRPLRGREGLSQGTKCIFTRWSMQVQPPLSLSGRPSGCHMSLCVRCHLLIYYSKTEKTMMWLKWPLSVSAENCPYSMPVTAETTSSLCWVSSSVGSGQNPLRHCPVITDTRLKNDYKNYT